MITNLPYYWLIANPVYQRKFNFFSAALEHREDYIVDEDSDEGNDCEQSDFVYIMLNLAYLKKGLAEEITLERGFSDIVKKRGETFESKTTTKQKKLRMSCGGMNANKTFEA